MPRTNKRLVVDGLVLPYNRTWTEDEVVDRAQYLLRETLTRGAGPYLVRVRLIVKTPMMKKAVRPDIMVLMGSGGEYDVDRVFIPVLLVEVRRGPQGKDTAKGKRMSEMFGGVPCIYCRGKEEADNLPGRAKKVIDTYLSTLDVDEIFRNAMVTAEEDKQLTLPGDGAEGEDKNLKALLPKGSIDPGEFEKMVAEIGEEKTIAHYRSMKGDAE